MPFPRIIERQPNFHTLRASGVAVFSKFLLLARIKVPPKVLVARLRSTMRAVNTGSKILIEKDVQPDHRLHPRELEGTA